MRVPFGNLEYGPFMNNQVSRWISEEVKEGRVITPDRMELQYFKAVQPRPDKNRGKVVIIHGHSEFFGKYHELAYDFYDMGYSVFFLQFRGHGKSCHVSHDPEYIHVSSFLEYVTDIKTFMDDVVMKEKGSGPVILFAHSMGGCASGLFLERHPGYFDSAILCSPLCKLSFPKDSYWKGRIKLFYSGVMGWQDEAVQGMKRFDPNKIRCIPATFSAVRYEYQFKQRVEEPEYRAHMTTYAWIRAAYQATQELMAKLPVINIPVLLLSGTDDHMLDRKGHFDFQRMTGNTRLVEIENASHDIYSCSAEILEQFWNAIDQFLADLECDPDRDVRLT